MKSFLFYTLACAIALLPGTAYAYIDPGSASLFITLLIGVLAGAAMALRTYWNKVKSIFGGQNNKEPPAEGEPGE